MQADTQICTCGREVEGQIEQAVSNMGKEAALESYNVFECECGEVWDDLESEGMWEHITNVSIIPAGTYPTFAQRQYQRYQDKLHQRWLYENMNLNPRYKKGIKP